MPPFLYPSKGFPLFFLRKRSELVPRTMRGTRERGIFSFSEREYPPYTPKSKDEGRAPRPPTLAVCSSNNCTRCAVWVRCTWLRHESSAIRCRYQPRPTPWGASDGSTAADCLRATLLRSPQVGLLLFYFNSVLFCERSAAYGNTRRTAARFGINKADKNKARTVA